MADLSKFEKILGVVFNNKDLLRLALTHRSYINENPPLTGGPGEQNERLEFLGDAVLELVITEYLYKQFSERPEGELTALRASLVNANMLGDAAG